MRFLFFSGFELSFVAMCVCCVCALLYDCSAWPMHHTRMGRGWEDTSRVAVVVQVWRVPIPFLPPSFDALRTPSSNSVAV